MILVKKYRHKSNVFFLPAINLSLFRSSSSSSSSPICPVWFSQHVLGCLYLFLAYVDPLFRRYSTGYRYQRPQIRSLLFSPILLPFLFFFLSPAPMLLLCCCSVRRSAAPCLRVSITAAVPQPRQTTLHLGAIQFSGGRHFILAAFRLGTSRFLHPPNGRTLRIFILQIRPYFTYSTVFLFLLSSRFGYRLWAVYLWKHIGWRQRFVAILQKERERKREKKRSI